MDEPIDVLHELIRRHAVIGQPLSALPGVKVLAADAPTAPFQSIYQPAFGLVAQGNKRAILGDRIFDYAAGQYLIVAVDLPVTGFVVEASPAEPYLAMSMELDPGLVTSLLLDQAPVAETPVATGLAISDATPDLLDCAIRVVRLLDAPGDVEILLPGLRRELHWRLLQGAQGGLLAQIGRIEGHTVQIARAIAWIRDHYAEPLPIALLAEIAGMSVSSFHRHFRAVTTMSPLQFHKQVRLLAARTHLLTEGVSAGSAGFAVGYQSAAQFTREYGRQFGAPPARDISRLRMRPPAEGSL